MAGEEESLERIEFWLKKGFQAHERACTRGEWYENVFRVHNALELALKIHLGEQAKDLTFTQKFQLLLPGVANNRPVGWLNGRRNDMGHPMEPVDDLTVYNTSVGLVDLATAAWPELFGKNAPPVRHPERRRSAQAAVGPLPASGVAPPAPAPAGSAPAFAATDRYGPVRRTQVAATVPGTAVPAPPAAPSAPAASQRSQPREQRLLYALLVVLLVLGAFLVGRQKAPPDPTGIGVGGRALVAVDAGSSAALTVGPGTRQTRVTGYNHGTVLDVTGGPITYEDMTWWKVRGPRGEGWIPETFLAPMGG